MNEDVPRNIDMVSLFLSFIAGYADTTTFFCANRLLSAHITGNIVLFVYNIITNADTSLWLNLLSIPFFIAGVVVASTIIYDPKNPGKIVKVEAVLFLVVSVIAAVLKMRAMESRLSDFLLAMVIVVAMGLHNSYRKIYTRATHTTTTVMTGNITELTIDLLRYARAEAASAELVKRLRHQALIIGGFFTGCLTGGWLSFLIGLPSIILPAIVTGFYFWRTHRDSR
jgi:uncharacterized membrane protein YoaK (UPF0700 family)